MTTAIILAAGMGKRLGAITTTTAKPLLIVGEKTLLEHAIDVAEGVGADRILVIGGYQLNAIKKMVVSLNKNIDVLDVGDYKRQTLSGVKRGLDEIEEGNVFICNSDYVKLPHTIEAMRKGAKDIAVYASFDHKAAEEDVMKIMTDKNTNLLAISKTLTKFNGLYTGDFFCEAKYLNDLKKAVAIAQKKNDPVVAVTEHSFLELKELGCPVKAVDVGDADWFEIDTPEELACAQKRYTQLNGGNKAQVVACNLCGLQNDEELYKDRQLRVVICTNCSLVYLSPRMNQEEYNKYYEDDYQKDRHEITSLDAAIKRLETKDSYSRKKAKFTFMKPYITASSKVLEIGAGMGTQLKVIADEVNCLVEGIEVSTLGAQVANEYYKIPVKQVTLDDFASVNDKKFSFILLHHVLEHFLNPTNALKMIHSFTEEDGMLYIAVPNMSHPDEPLDRFFRLPHTYYYTLHTLKGLLTRAGWEMVIADVGKQEIKVIAKKINPKERDAVSYANPEEVKEIRALVTREALKYKALRSMKKLTRNMLSESAYKKVRRSVIGLLRKLGIITV